MLMEGIVPYSHANYVERMVRRASTAAVCLLLAGMIGCGGSGDSGGNPEQELRQWYVGVEKSVAAMEAKQRGFTRFRVNEPPEKSEIVQLSPAGARAGETAAAAARQLDTATALTADEAAGLYCYFFAFYVDLEFSPDKEEFEEVILNLVEARLSPSASPDEVRESAAALRKAMIAAEKAGERGGKVAAAIFCQRPR
jgi:hypothetical protein